MGSTGLLLIAHEWGKLVFEGKLLDSAHVFSLEPPACFLQKKRKEKKWQKKETLGGALSSLCSVAYLDIFLSYCFCIVCSSGSSFDSEISHDKTNLPD